METTRETWPSVAGELERFVREIGQVADDDADFTRQVHLTHSGYLDSHGMVELIVYIEKNFRIDLHDDELSDPGFMNIDGMSAAIEANLRDRASGRGRDTV